MLDNEFFTSGKIFQTKRYIGQGLTAKKICYIILKMKPFLEPDEVHYFHIKYGNEGLDLYNDRFLNSWDLNYRIKINNYSYYKQSIWRLGDINNYRLVMMSSIFLKGLELDVLNKLKWFQRKSIFQLGHLLKETILWYLKKMLCGKCWLIILCIFMVLYTSAYEIKN